MRGRGRIFSAAIARPTFYYELSSAYAYLAANRIGTLLPEADWQPILLAGLFKLNGRQSWYLSGDPQQRQDRMQDIENRARAYGLPPVRWFSELPQNLLNLGRAATVARREGLTEEFSLAVFHALFAEGRDPSVPDELTRLGEAAGLDGDALIRRIQEQEIKDELRQSTEGAHALGVPGVPAVAVGGRVFWGDDRLEDAAAAARS